MNKEIVSYVVEKSHELMEAFSCSKEAKDAAQAWLDAVGTAGEAEATKAYVAELEADIVPIDSLISLAESEQGARIFGEEKSKEVAAHARKIKSEGAAYCDCPACAAALAIVEKKAELLD